MLEVRLLGQFAVKLDGRAVTLPSRPAQSLLAYLALSAGTAHRREKLAGLLWPESSDENARRNLRQSLWHIRKALGDAAHLYLLSDDISVSFTNTTFWLDVALLEKPTDANATPEELMAVVAMYGGELLPGFYDDWVVWQRERQQTLFERKMEQLLDRLTAVHRWDDLLEWGERWLALGQSPEAAYRALMVAYAGRGDLARMAAVYRRCVAALENDLGVEPSPQTKTLFEQLSRGEDGDVLAAALFPRRYQLLEEVGRGGMGVVYRAHDTRLARDVAVKMLAPNALDADGRARLLREAQAIARLNHPNIVTVFDTGEVDGRPYIVMELVNGRSLRQHQPQTLDESLHITRQICLALEHAHSNGVIHRDLKPENILVANLEERRGGGWRGNVPAKASTPVIKLMDFGLARTPESPNLTQEGAIVGTFAYLAPEIIQGQPASVQSDLYALGVMLYELAAGRPPFAADNAAALISHRLDTPVTPPQWLNPAVPPDLSELIERLLHKQPSDRPVSATAVREVIERLSSDSPPAISSSPIPSPSDGSHRPHLLTQTLKHNLPPQPTRFIGREAEVTAVRRQLAQPTTRLLTLTGTGGTGKTRLSLQVAAEVLPDFADGVWFVPLAAITDPNLVAVTIARQLGLQESPGMPPWPEILATYLQDKRLLLVLDNFEQITAAAPLLAELLAATSRLKLLVTSRVHLHLSGEQSVAVPPLALPDSQKLPPLVQLTQVEAVQLFVERSLAVKPDFALTLENAPDVAEICARLDGLPLAIELAATRIRLMSPRQMRERLGRRLQWLTGGARDAPARQQTLRATLDWSHDLLPAAEQTLFRRLAVFVGGWTLEAAEAVANGEGNLDILNGLESLLDHHLLQQHEVAGEPRFTMLETIREYALEKLAESGETEAMWQQHATYYADYCRERLTRLQKRDRETLAELKTEQDNLRAVWDWAVANRQASILGRMAQPFAIFMDQFSDNREQFYRFETAVKALAGLEDSLARQVQAYALLEMGNALMLLGKLAEADETLQASEQHYQALAIPYAPGLGTDPLLIRSIVSWMRSDFAVAIQLGEKGLQRAQAEENRFNEAYGHFVLSGANIASGLYEKARAHGQQAFALMQNLGDIWFLAYCHVELGKSAQALGDFAAAECHFETAFKLRHAFEDRTGMGMARLMSGECFRRQSKWLEAQQSFSDAQAIYQEIYNRIGLSRAFAGLGDVATGLGYYDKARHLYARGLALVVETGLQTYAHAVLVGVGEWFLALGYMERSLEVLTAVAHDPRASMELKKRAGTHLTAVHEANKVLPADTLLLAATLAAELKQLDISLSG